MSAPRQTLVLGVAALATVLATCVAVAHGDRERDRPPRAPARDRRERPAPRDGRADRPAHRRRLDRAGPAVGAARAVRRARLTAARPEGADLGRARPQRRPRRPVRSGADDAVRPPAALQIVFSRSRGKGDPTRDAVRQSAGRAALQGAIRSGDTRATGVLPAVGGSPAAASPWRCRCARPPPGASGAFLATFSLPGRPRRGRAPTCRPARASRSSRATADRRAARAAREARPARRPRLDRRRRAARGAPGPRAGHAAGRRPADDPDRRRRLAGAGASATRWGVIAMRRAERDRAELARPRPRSARACWRRPPPT